MIFEPSWSLHIGERHEKGTGLLGKLWHYADQFDLFSVTMNGTQIIVLPKEGKIMQNLQTIWEGGRGKLVWLRKMKMLIGPNVNKTECECYGIGLEIGEKRIGFRLYEDGRVERGLDA